MNRLVHISEAASLAIRSMTLIASSSERLNPGKISAILHVSQNHLVKILKDLAKKEYMESNRGPGVGFTIRKNADEITILEIYQLIERNVDCRICGITENNCPFINCIFGGKPDKLSNEFVEYSTNTKISYLKTNYIKYA
jgi:Rrf2 family transcriptional regulator, nitric oxide-sensitive transcriptional repressor